MPGNFTKSIEGWLDLSHERSRSVSRSIFRVFYVRIFSAFFAFALIATGVSYLHPSQYGIWVALSSILCWVCVFDFGFGLGLRNRLAEANAKGDITRSRKLVSTAYVLTGLLVLSLILVYYLIHPYINWHAILNCPLDQVRDLNTLVFVCFSAFSLRLVVRLINSIAAAKQRIEIGETIDMIGQGLSLVTILILARYKSPSVFSFGIVLSVLPLGVSIIGSLILFRRIFKSVSPSFALVDIHLVSGLTNLGAQFFVLNIASLVVFSAMNLIIIQLFGPEEVTAFNVVFRYFGIVVMISNIVFTPLWSAFTDAYTQRDLQWIRESIKKLIKAWSFLVIIVMVQIVFAQKVFSLWVGDDVRVSTLLILTCALYVVLVTWNNIYAHFLNGSGKVRLQTYASVGTMILFVPLAIYLSSGLSLGPAGVVLTSCATLAISAIWAPIQYHLIVAGKATGIWAK